MSLPTTPVNVTALPFRFDPAAATSPNGAVLAADSLSMLHSTGKGYPLRRWYPVSGEIHLARVPASQWREQLMRMKAGGLDMIAVYVFWIHHEENRGNFTFTGRRNVTQFLGLVKELGLRALMRVGPWDHGECRNGGHPDWVLDACKPLRTTDPNYLGCVQPFYKQLAAQMAGMYVVREHRISARLWYKRPSRAYRWSACYAPNVLLLTAAAARGPFAGLMQLWFLFLFFFLPLSPRLHPLTILPPSPV